VPANISANNFKIIKEIQDLPLGNAFAIASVAECTCSFS
jgi:hypothetical protein